MGKQFMILMLLLACIPYVARAQTESSAQTEPEEPNYCISCHLDLDEDGLVWIEDDVHTRRGLSCVACHGGDQTVDDPDEAKARGTGFVGAPSRTQIPDFCGKCHNNAVYIRDFDPGLRVDQLDLYWTSVHGEKLRAGDENVATCIDCHDNHGILSSVDARSWVHPSNVPETCGRCHADEERMAPYGIPTDQLEKFKLSVHGHLLESGARGAPTCNVCHGNHGATPPGVSSVSNVCGQCHPLNADLIRKSPHGSAFEMLEVAACESCHGHHDILQPNDEMLGTGPQSFCTECHEEDSNGYLAASAMQGLIVQLQEHRNIAAELIEGAERAGLEVRDAKFELSEVDNQLTKARTTVHSYALSQVEAVVAVGDSLANAAVIQGEEAMAELQTRRMGLGVSLIVILVVGIALYIKIREQDEHIMD